MLSAAMFPHQHVPEELFINCVVLEDTAIPTFLTMATKEMDIAQQLFARLLLWRAERFLKQQKITTEETKIPLALETSMKFATLTFLLERQILTVFASATAQVVTLD